MRRYDIHNPDDREYLTHVVLSPADLVADAPSAVGLTEALRGRDLSALVIATKAGTLTR